MKKKIIVGIFLFSLVFALATAGKSDVELGIVEDMNMIDAWGNGYPTNARGETYGVDVKENSKSPDLILVENSEGILAVSYTHLDVYKRQAYIHCEAKF